MARRRRYHIQGATYHVMLRGNGGEPIFFDDQDRCRMCLLIQEGIERYVHRVLAYCFMTNHVHLAIQISQVKLSRIMQNLAFRYARYLNGKYRRIGHVFQGRFKAILVDSNRYLKELVRYIHLNPVRAGMVNLPEDYRWCSHSVYLGSSELVWLTKNTVLNRFSDKERISIAAFQNFVRSVIGLREEINFKQGSEDGILGDDNFVAKIREKSMLMSEIELSISELVTAVCEFHGINIESLLKQGKEHSSAKIRGIIALMVREVEDLTLEDLGRYLQRDANGLSRLAARLNAKSLKSSELSQEIQRTKTYLYQMSECPAFLISHTFVG